MNGKEIIESLVMDITPSNDGFAWMLATIALDGNEAAKKWAIDCLCEMAYSIRPFGTDNQ